MIHVVEGQLLSLEASFLDDFGDPVYPEDDGFGPLVKILDSDDSIINESVAVPHPDPSKAGFWTVDLGVPDMGLNDAVNVRVQWSLKSDMGDSYSLVQILQVMPSRQHRSSDPVMLFEAETDPNDEDSNTFVVVVPAKYTLGDRLLVKIYRNNSVVGKYDTNNGAAVLGTYSDRFEVRVPYRATLDRLEPVTVIVSFRPAGASVPKDYTYMLWVVTPQILTAARLVEDHIDKARLENVIPELEYTQADLIQYLYRGLALFNNTPPRITNFNGLNMQGTILDNWLVCSCYYALAAQLQAEGAMTFDFSGQTVSLNMDRSPAIESALGRIEGVIADKVHAAKVLLSRAGCVSGDGSAGGRFIDGSRAFGVLGVTQSPLTKYGNSGAHATRWFNSRYTQR
jgi:hypothetical protein